MTNFGIIGLGKFARNYVRVINSFKQAVSIPLVCSRNGDSYLNNMKELNLNHIWYDDYKKVCESDLVDVIIVCTPPESHYQITKCALENGKHVICEKPFVFEKEQAKELNSLAEEKKLCLIINYIHLWNDFYQKLRDFNIKNKISNIRFNLENPKTNREHHSILWDWAPHELSMACHLFKINADNIDIKVMCNKDSLKESDLMHIKLYNNDLNIDISINTNAKSKKRIITATDKNENMIQVSDSFFVNPLEQMIADFINARDNNIRISNGELACNVTELLQAINSKI